MNWESFFNNVSNLISRIGSLDETAFIIQKDSVGGMHFHY